MKKKGMESISTPASKYRCQEEEEEEDINTEEEDDDGINFDTSVGMQVSKRRSRRIYTEEEEFKALISTPVSKWRCPTEDAEEIHTVEEEGDGINTDEEGSLSRSIKFFLLFVTLNFLPFSSFFGSTHSGCKSCNSTARFPNPQHFSLVGGFKPSVISGKKANGKWGG